MNLIFLGAAHEVTGSCTLLTACGKNILIDCGMEQGPDTYKNRDIPVSPADIDCIFLTHAHIDHSGKLPYLTANGYKGPIYATASTAKLCRIMLEDSAHIQQFEAQWRNRRAKRSGEAGYVPLYTVEDAQKCCSQFLRCEYGVDYHVFDGVSISFTDAGHLLGSSSITINVTENGETEKIVFSGDIGNTDQPIIRDPQYITDATYVITESTYGDRSHGERLDYISVTFIVMLDEPARRQCSYTVVCRRQNSGAFILYKADKGRAYAQKLQRLPRICGQSPCS